MILGLGIDIVHVRRIHHWMETEGLVERFFHPEEAASSKDRGHAEALSLAARFAAKEAFGKALGTGLAGMRLRDIQVINNHNGRPDMILHGTALERFRALGAARVLVSLTHESDNAVAVVVIEG
ncbi:MAG TPA: holo-ACP synthase [Spirochaetales bacterium]|nr:holo-ACP synthase [Spirochaetales bacterium]HRY56201.1 holo-ACP synthase [Spirochaetia bacterium]HRZ64037.1 holo-ACP synthase [Spirochaetia bacterium]